MVKKYALPVIIAVLLLGFGLSAPLIAWSQTEQPKIRLEWATFDPLQGGPVIPASRTASVVAAERQTYLVQFSGPVNEEWKSAVKDAGAQLYGYIPDYAFLARMDGNTADQLRGLSFVRWVGLYQPAYRASAALNNLLQMNISALKLTVQTLPDADQAALKAQITGLGGVVQDSAVNELAGYLTITLPASSVDSVLALDGVVRLEPDFADQLYNDVATGQIMGGAEVRLNLGLYGAGQVVAVADTGLDTGDLNTMHPDIKGRIKKTFALGRSNDWSDPNGHGTHVTGSVLGNGTQSGSNASAHQYAGSYAGMAPEAWLVFQSLLDPNGGLGGVPADRGDLMRQAYAEGARIHTNSWGGQTGDQTNPFGGYVASSQQVDLAAWEMKNMFILFAAGNSGVDANKDGVVDNDSIGQPGTAKNVLTVGASENLRPTITNTWGNSYGAPIDTDKKGDNKNGMAAFSSRGPTDDGRVKPEIAAPGAWIASTRTHTYVLNDNLEGDTSTYSNLQIGNGTQSWTLVADAHSGSHAWQQSVNGNYNQGDLTGLFTPALNLSPEGGDVDFSFFQKYSLTGDDAMMVIILGKDAQNPAQSKSATLTLQTTGTQSTYQLTNIRLYGIRSIGIDTSSVRIGLAITSTNDTSFASSWEIDDLRIDGADWGTLSSVGLTTGGSSIDNDYLMEGGTSMATPLTAGAAALVREWLIKDRAIADPTSALVKAVLLNGAADMSPGQYGTGAAREIPAVRPNNVSGWGRVDLVQSLMPPTPRKIWLKDNTTGVATGATASYTLYIQGTGGQSLPTQAPPGPGATNTTAPSALPVPNGDFEQGAAVGWSHHSTNGWDLIYDATQYTFPVAPRSGHWMARLGGVGSQRDVVSDIWQNFTLPANKPVYLLLYYQIRADDCSIYNTFTLYVNGKDEGDLKLCDSSNTSSWMLAFKDLSAYMGQTVEIRLGVYQGEFVPAYFFVDDVSFTDVKPNPLSVGYSQELRPRLSLDPLPALSAPQSVNQASGTANLIVNGSMEAATGWGMQNFAYSTAEAHGGSRSAASTPGVDSAMCQTVAIPADATGAVMDFYWKNVNPDLIYDSLTLEVWTSDLQNLLYSGNSLWAADTTWQQDTEDLSANLPYWAGQTIAVCLRTYTDGIDPNTTFYVDDVTFTVTTPGGTTPVPTSTNTPVTPVATSTNTPVTPAPTHTNTPVTPVATTVTPGGPTLTHTPITPTATSTTGGPLRITLVWTDYPGEPSAAKALVNDLDLEVIAPDGTHYYGNTGVYPAGNACLRDGKWDTCNNAETVYIPVSKSGSYTIIVHGYNVPQGGSQPFAIVASGDNASSTPPGPVPTSTPKPPATLKDKHVFLPVIKK